MSSSLLRALVIAAGLLWTAGGAAQPAAPASAPGIKMRVLPTEARVWKGDFDRMLERRHIRVLVPYSRTLFYNDKGRERGISAETARTTCVNAAPSRPPSS